MGAKLWHDLYCVQMYIIIGSMMFILAKIEL